jgi:nitrate reductase (NAD(P)H)
MVRLTGRHPFNVEAPLPKLFEQGFITPAALHYVRNHGAVPKISWEEHRLSVGGIVDSPTTFTMDDLLAMPARELPITLVCAGNRRKEENLVAQGIGFNWGAAGVSTSVWKGVSLRDVLIKCGIKRPTDGANHVCFVGVEKMPKGRYGTSIDYFTAMDPACDVMLAYEQNGEKLQPDHGFPLRLIIPGYIGGRMIKWLNEITVTTEESDNYFHYNDNRVLPEHVTAEIANAEGWWYKPDYIINQLNINSAIAQPGHLEVVPLNKKGQTYPIKGYCYTGGGRKVIRVEVSIDGGKTWTLSKLNHPETPTEYGRYWCWCFFELEVALADVWALEQPEILCRGWDAAMNRQPENITWNVMGMMNNSYFRVKVHRTMHEGLPALQFQHPTLAGPGNFGGWFEEKVLGKVGDEDKSKLAAAAAAATPTPTGGGKTISMSEVEKNDGTKGTDCWFVVKNKVYNGTPYMAEHPGGPSSIQIVGGQDCTEEFEALHSSKAWTLLEKFYLGDLATADSAAPTGAPAAEAKEVGPPTTLDPKKYVTLPLEKRIDISHDTRLFRFSLPSKEHILGLPVGQHLFIRADIDGKKVMRAYTPLDSGVGYVDFVIKVYFANVHPRFPEGGKLTQHLEGMKIGETIQVKGPLGEYIFNVTMPKGITRQPNSMVTFTHTPTETKTPFDQIGFIAGGSGITPVLQTARALLADPSINVKISILYANRSESDILCLDTLTQIAELPNVSVWYTLDQPPEGWKYSSGFISEEMVKDHLPAAAPNSYIFCCGPPPMINFACKPNLAKVGHAESNVHCF